MSSTVLGIFLNLFLTAPRNAVISAFTLPATLLWSPPPSLLARPRCGWLFRERRYDILSSCFCPLRTSPTPPGKRHHWPQGRCCHGLPLRHGGCSPPSAPWREREFVASFRGNRCSCRLLSLPSSLFALFFFFPLFSSLARQTSDVSKAVQQIAEDFGCKPVENMLSHQLSRNVIDGEKAVLFNPSDQLKCVSPGFWFSLFLIVRLGDDVFPCFT